MGNLRQIWITFVGNFKGFRLQIEILSTVFGWIAKHQLNLLLFLSDWYSRKLGLMDLLGHDGKVISHINFILSPYYRSYSADRDYLYELLINIRLLWAMMWNNKCKSEYESVSQISIWIKKLYLVSRFILPFLFVLILIWKQQ